MMQTAQARLDSMGSSLEQETSQRQLWSREVQQASDQTRQELESVARCIAEVQMAIQVRDQRISDLEEVIPDNAVTMECGLQECRDGLRQAQIPEKGQMSEAPIMSMQKMR